LLSPARVISETNKHIDKILAGDLKILRKIKSFVIKSGGKRIRPLFQYYVGKAYRLADADLLRLGALIEIIHAASLLHDDVVDEADERRALPTARILFGNKEVVLGGDHLLSSGLKFLNSMGSPPFMDIFTDAIRALSEAELLQLQQHFDLKTSAKTHLRIIDGKTAVLFQAAGALVGSLAGHKGDVYRHEAAVLGLGFGRFFQERDDYLDYFDSARLKKKGLQDFSNGIVTRPLRLLLEKASKADFGIVKEKWRQIRQDLGSVDPQPIVTLMEKYLVKENCSRFLNAEQQKISDQLARLPEPAARRLISAEFQKILAVPAA